MAQLWLSVANPGQSNPPNDGAGFEQARVRRWIPPPQVTEHSPNPLQADHIPSAESNIFFSWCSTWWELFFLYNALYKKRDERQYFFLMLLWNVIAKKKFQILLSFKCVFFSNNELTSDVEYSTVIFYSNRFIHQTQRWDCNPNNISETPKPWDKLGGLEQAGCYSKYGSPNDPKG